jgi:hypothetical protein
MRNAALLILFDLARRLNVSLRIEFEWRDKEDAERPGERAVVYWTAPKPKRE